MIEKKGDLRNIPASQLFKEVDAMAKKLSVPDASKRPVVQILPGNDPKHKILELKRGSWSDPQPWFVIDEDGRLMVLSSAKSMQDIINSLQHMGQEVFRSKLERSIAKELPIDFNDVWTVAMHELQKKIKDEKMGEGATVDLDQLVKSIKRKHPNLFYSLKDLDLEELADEDK